MNTRTWPRESTTWRLCARCKGISTRRSASSGSLDLRKALYGEEHEEVAAGLVRLGTVYSFQGRYDEAEPILREALAMQKRLLGEEHADVADGLKNLATLLQRQGKYIEAEPCSNNPSPCVGSSSGTSTRMSRRR